MVLQNTKKSMSQGTRLLVPATPAAGVPKPAAAGRQLVEEALLGFKWPGQIKASVTKAIGGNSSESREFLVLEVGKRKLKSIKSDLLLFCLSFRSFIIWLHTSFA